MRVFAQDLGEGRPVVLLAGFGLDHEVWDAQVRQLAAAGHRAVCIDLRGTGLSDKPLSGYEIERLALDVEAVLDELDLRAVTLVGWSFGGQVAFRVAASAPGRLAQLVLVASNVRASRSEAFPFGRPPDELEPALIRAEQNGRIAARRETIAAGFHVEPDEQTLAWLTACSLRMPSWAAEACYRSMLRTDLVEDIPRVAAPVLQLFGANDPVHSRKGARWLAERLADARIAELERCGHFPMFEAREAFDAALIGFVDAGPGSMAAAGAR